MSNTRMLSEAEAWREIARRVAELSDDEWTYLCWYLSDCGSAAHRPISAPERLRVRMAGRVREHVDAARWTGYYDDDQVEGHYYESQGWHETTAEEGRDIRVLAALFLALEAEDDARGAA